MRLILRKLWSLDSGSQLSSINGTNKSIKESSGTENCSVLIWRNTAFRLVKELKF